MTLLMPRAVEEALALRAAHPHAMVVAGGTDALVRWPEQASAQDRQLLDLSGVTELRPWALDESWLTLGALTTYWDLLEDRDLCQEFPFLEQAAREVGAVQIQTRGTWAGNVMNASPAADGVLVLMAYDAVVEARSTDGGAREWPLAEFYLGYRQTPLRTDELVTAIRIPRMERHLERFEKVGSRRAQTISKLGLAVCQVDGAWRVVVNSMAPTVRRCPALEQALSRTPEPSSPADWLPPIRQDLAPIDDLRSTRHYREQVLARLLHTLDVR